MYTAPSQRQRFAGRPGVRLASPPWPAHFFNNGEKMSLSDLPANQAIYIGDVPLFEIDGKFQRLCIVADRTVERSGKKLSVQKLACDPRRIYRPFVCGVYGEIRMGGDVAIVA